MLDFIQIRTKEIEEGLEMYPDFLVGRSEDLMVQGRTFYAVWDEEARLWSRDEYSVARLVDEALQTEADRVFDRTGVRCQIKFMRSFGSNAWIRFKKFIASIGDNSHPLDAKLVFANTEVKKSDYSSRRLSYSLEEGDCSAWIELISTLYSPEERAKIEWAIGSIVSGDSRRIQKFLVLYGPPGTGKSTILNIIQALFEGYTTTFDGKALGSSNASFATEVFKHGPLVAIQHDGDLSRLEDNARLNSIIAHEEMVMNEKYKPSYTSRVEAMLFIGSNQPVKISDAKSGIIRRLIDIHPTGVKLPPRQYQSLMDRLSFEHGAIAAHCLKTYLEMGPNYYNAYRPTEMMLQTDIFFNYIEAHYDTFYHQNGVSLAQAYKLYKEFCEQSGIDRPIPKHKFRDELRNYFDEFKDRKEVDGVVVRSWYSGFNADKFKTPTTDVQSFALVLEETTSLLDEFLSGCLAQPAKADGTPTRGWTKVTTTLSDIDTSLLHYVKVPENHIVIDFDLKGVDGDKSLDRNLEAAAAWPATYAELSKSGAGVHLHYLYTGDPERLASEFADGVEVKVFRGDSSLRRLRTKCNAVPVSTISSGLPLKEVKKVHSDKTIKSERGLRELIERNLRKDIHPGTKPSVDFIKKVLDDAYESGMAYDVTDLRARVLAFANNSSNQALECLKIVQQMKWVSDVEIESEVKIEVPEAPIVFFDVEVYSNLFVVCWKYQGSDQVVRMINPPAAEIENLLEMKLVGFYNRRYDNHILFAAAMGWTPAQLFDLSQKLIVENNRNAPFAMAYGISYADIWDFSSIKQSLKKFEVDLGILHMELDIPWDEPVPEEQWPRVVEYCVNDVNATEAVFNDRREDFLARQILAELSGLSVNDTTQKHTAKIIFGDDKKAHEKFNYVNLEEEFSGYKFEGGKSSYRGEDPGEGGYVYAEPGYYENVALLDVASMHPTSIVVLDAFGPYTQKFEDLMKARLAIKRRDFETAREMLDGRLAPFLTEEEGADKLAYALKIVINIVYGLTSAKFDNPFRDLRNVDNIVAKRGALFMIDLKLALQNKGVKVVHIKTDSVKIADMVPDSPFSIEIMDFIMDFGSKYGYTFEHEANYDVFCLVNDAVYVAREHDRWTTVGAQFQHPYVYKSLFSHEPIGFDDFCESRSVLQGTMYLDEKQTPKEELDHRKMTHLGKTGRFVPVIEGGGVLYRVMADKDGVFKYYAVTRTKGHLWVDAEIAAQRGDALEVDIQYFEDLKLAAEQTLFNQGMNLNELLKE